MVRAENMLSPMLFLWGRSFSTWTCQLLKGPTFWARSAVPLVRAGSGLLVTGYDVATEV